MGGGKNGDEQPRCRRARVRKCNVKGALRATELARDRAGGSGRSAAARLSSASEHRGRCALAPARQTTWRRAQLAPAEAALALAPHGNQRRDALQERSL
jgi:hypothetical protein